MAKVTKSFTLDEEVFAQLERLATMDCRNNSAFLNVTLKKAFDRHESDLDFLLSGDKNV